MSGEELWQDIDICHLVKLLQWTCSSKQDFGLWLRVDEPRIKSFVVKYLSQY